MANKKRIAATLGAMALTAVIAVGGTLAYLTHVTETKTNTFSSSKDITTELSEKFDPEEAKTYTPGKVITKTPVITNTSEEGMNAYIAVSLDYTNGASSITAKEFAEYAEIQGMNVIDWTKIGTAADGKELYMYNTLLASGAKTNPIFTAVKVNAGILEVKKTGKTGEIIYTRDSTGKLIDVKDNTTIVDTTKYYNAKGEEISAKDAVAGLPTFEIKVQGYAVQGADVTEELAKTELIKLANATLGVEFK